MWVRESTYVMRNGDKTIVKYFVCGTAIYVLWNKGIRQGQYNSFSEAKDGAAN